MEFETYTDPSGVEDPPEPPTPPPVMRPKPKQLALPPPPAKRTLAEKASERANRRIKTEKPDEPPDEPPAPEPDEATVEIGRNDMAALMHATRLFAVTMDDAVATLGEAAATMNNLFKGQFK